MKNIKDRINDIMKMKIVIRKKTAIFIIFSISLVFLLLVSYFLFIDTDQFDKEDLNKFLENKKTAECMGCHTKGQQSVTAKDTIDESSCYKCHREDIDFLIPVSKQVHIYHEGNVSILPGYPSIDYSVRHKEILGDCGTCHVYESGRIPACVRCHTGDHIDSKKGIDCLSCHGKLDNLFKHDSINLETHNIYGNSSCDMCHSLDKIGLELANGNKVSITQSSGLCKQCHYETYKKWANGNHFSSIECVICHNPHSPRYVNQTIIDITKDINEKEKKEISTSDTGPKPTEVILKRKYSYDQVENT